MSVATKNPFAILDDDQDLDDAPQKEEEPTSPQPPTPSRGAAKSRGGGPAARAGKYYNRGGKTQAPKETPAAEEPANDDQRKSGAPRGGDRDRERGRGRGRGRGDSGGRGRPYDRHSQTGKIDSDKKIHNSWGGDDGNTELKTEEAATDDAAAEATNNWGGAVADGWGVAEANTDAWESAPVADATTAPAEGEPKPEGARGRKDKEAEEEDNTLTLDQYLAQQKEKEAAIPKLEGVRKANEGADDIWKGAVPLTKNEEEGTYYVGKTKQTTKSRPKKEEKIYIEIDAHFERPDRGGRGRGRGDRGGDRGRGDRGDRGGDRSRGGRGRGGGGSRGGRPHGNDKSTINVDSQNDFPSLS